MDRRTHTPPRFGRSRSRSRRTHTPVPTRRPARGGGAGGGKGGGGGGAGQFGGGKGGGGGGGRGSVGRELEEVGGGGSLWSRGRRSAGGASSSAAPDDGGRDSRWVNNLLMELNGEVVEDLDDDQDQCELSSCAPRLLTAGGYNRHHYEGEVRMHACARIFVCITGCLL